MRFASVAPRSWLARVVLALVLAALVGLGIFFMAIFLAVGAVVAAVLLVRWWWLTRKIRRAQREASIEGEYVVVEPTPYAPERERNVLPGEGGGAPRPPGVGRG